MVVGDLHPEAALPMFDDFRPSILPWSPFVHLKDGAINSPHTHRVLQCSD